MANITQKELERFERQSKIVKEYLIKQKDEGYMTTVTSLNEYSTNKEFTEREFTVLDFYKILGHFIYNVDDIREIDIEDEEVYDTEEGYFNIGIYPIKNINSFGSLNTWFGGLRDLDGNMLLNGVVFEFYINRINDVIKDKKLRGLNLIEFFNGETVDIYLFDHNLDNIKDSYCGYEEQIFDESYEFIQDYSEYDFYDNEDYDLTLSNNTEVFNDVYGEFIKEMISKDMYTVGDVYKHISRVDERQLEELNKQYTVMYEKAYGEKPQDARVYQEEKGDLDHNNPYN